MFKTTLIALLFGISTLNGLTLTCPPGTGDTELNPCAITSQQLQVDDDIRIEIPSSINYAMIYCQDKGCEKKVTAFLGAKKTIILCLGPDSCLASKFYCGRGPPDSNQEHYRGTNFFTPECILDADLGISSVAKEAEVVAFEPAKFTVKAVGDVAFGTALFRCYGNANCILQCGRGACVDTETDGDGTVNCIDTEPNGNNCADISRASSSTLFPPIIAKPDINNNCVVKPSDLANTDSKTKIVFKNNCVTATLNCTDSAAICEKRQIFCAAQNECNIQCGGPDITKLNENPVPSISGACKESIATFGPFDGSLPFGTNEGDYDRPINPISGPTILDVNINYIGSDAGGKSRIYSMLADVNINANGEKTFSEGRVNCGLGSCNLNCMNGPISGQLACEKCLFTETGGNFVSIGETCRDGSISNRVGVRQSSVNSVDSESSNINKKVVMSVKLMVTLCVLIGIIIVSVCAYKSCICGNKDEKVNLIQHELISVENQA